MSTIDLAAARILRLREGTGTRRSERAAAPVPAPSATAVAPPTADAAAGTHAASASWPARVLAAWGRRRRIAAGLVALRELDDRMLADLGLERSGIERAARTGRD